MHQPIFPMRVVVVLLLCGLLMVSGDDEQRYEVVGIGECGDCKQNNFKTSQAFSGLHVTIDCKFKTGEIKTIGDGEVDEDGTFVISLPQEIILEDGKSLKEACYAQLHSAAAAIPCSESTKITFKSHTNGKHTFSPVKTLEFSSALCTSKFLPKTHSWKKSWPKISFPPLKKWPPLYKTKPLLPPSPIVKPLPPPTPIYKPTVKPHHPIYKSKPLPPPTPTYKPKPPLYKPKPPKKSLPPPTPIYKPKPKPLVVKPLPPPLVTKPFPQYPIPPFFKKPCPPFSKIPPNYFKHPKFGYFPPVPPFFPHP